MKVIIRRCLINLLGMVCLMLVGACCHPECIFTYRCVADWRHVSAVASHIADARWVLSTVSGTVKSGLNDRKLFLYQ